MKEGLVDHCVASLENQLGMKLLHQVVVLLMDPLADHLELVVSPFVMNALECRIESCAVFYVKVKTF